MQRRELEDLRNRFWSDIEGEIQSRAGRKDKSFRLRGKWKKYVRRQSGYRIYSVDSRWIRDNLCVYFSHGGHGLVHEFIPVDEIWVSSHHYYEGENTLAHCVCRVRKKGMRVSKNYFESTVIHEITEIEEMKKGKSYQQAHRIALRKEEEIGLISDPFSDP
ncbi:MAG: hypothetical protein ABIH11_04550 [Candidatus Altiarchaeota archaeon]